VGDAAHYVPLLASAAIDLIELGTVPARQLAQRFPRGGVVGELLAADASPFATVLALLAGTLAHLRPKALFAQLDIVNVLAGTAALASEVPHTVLSLRNYSPARFPYLDQPWFRPVYQELARSSRMSLAGNSRAGNADYASWLGVPPGRIAWIPNAVVAEQAPAPQPAELEELRRELGLSDAAPVILGVFRLSDEKRPQMFIDVYAKLLETHPHVRALIAGVGPLSATLREHIRKRGLEGRVSLLGRRNDIDALMRVSTLLLLTSTFEGMPNAVLEAQLAGLPVVASNVGGVPDCIAEGGGGHLVEPDDFEGFVARCSAIIANRSRDTGGMELLRKFPRKAMAERFVALVNNACKNNATAVRAARRSSSSP
jgi:glycosyltransferase involved in cell wall biosynthesis